MSTLLRELFFAAVLLVLSVFMMYLSVITIPMWGDWDHGTRMIVVAGLAYGWFSLLKVWPLAIFVWLDMLSGGPRE